MSTGEMQSVLEGHTHWVLSVAFSNDGTQIASGSSDQSVRIWDLQASFMREKVADSYGRAKPTGWLLSPNKKNHLMFIPLDANLPEPPTILCFHAVHRPLFALQMLRQVPNGRGVTHLRLLLWKVGNRKVFPT